MNPLQKLQTLGQSPWQDNISRDQLVSGMLQDMVNDGDITGLTSNPTIFQQAISGSNDYDVTISKLSSMGFDAEDIFYALASDVSVASVFGNAYGVLTESAAAINIGGATINSFCGIGIPERKTDFRKMLNAKRREELKKINSD